MICKFNKCLSSSRFWPAALLGTEATLANVVLPALEALKYTREQRRNKWLIMDRAPLSNVFHGAKHRVQPC